MVRRFDRKLLRACWQLRVPSWLWSHLHLYVACDPRLMGWPGNRMPLKIVVHDHARRMEQIADEALEQERRRLAPSFGLDPMALPPLDMREAVRRYGIVRQPFPTTLKDHLDASQYLTDFATRVTQAPMPKPQPRRRPWWWPWGAY